VDKNTTVDTIRRAWYLIREYRDCLSKYQPWRESLQEHFYDTIWHMRERGWSSVFDKLKGTHPAEL